MPAASKNVTSVEGSESATAASTLALLRSVDPVREAHVDCGACRLCCHHQRVLVTPGDPEELYDTESVLDGKFKLLRQRPDGSCIHLGPGGCEVYENRPAICRAFDCGGWFRSWTRDERRQMSRQDPTVKALLERGREISAGQIKGGAARC